MYELQMEIFRQEVKVTVQNFDALFPVPSEAFRVKIVPPLPFSIQKQCCDFGFQVIPLSKKSLCYKLKKRQNNPRLEQYLRVFP